MNILFDSLELIYGSSGKPFFLIWEANTLSDILVQLGCTNTYAEVCYMPAQMKSDVAAAEDIAGGKAQFLSIKRNIEVLGELSNVIYRKATQKSTLYFAEEINKIAEEANRIMSTIPVVFRVSSDETAGGDIPVNAGQKLLYTSVFSILRAMVRSSDRKLFNLEISYENGFAVMSSTFSLKPDTHKGMITDSFEMYCAKMYIESLGGQLSYAFYDEIGQIRLVLPKANVAAFSSAVFTSDEKVCEKLAGIFMTDAAEQ